MPENQKISFSETVNQNLLETPKSTQAEYTLPCGFIDTMGALHQEVRLREMTGREEDLLASNKLSPQRKINALIINCLEQIGTITDRSLFAGIVPQLPIGDRIYLLLALRRTSLGDDFPVEMECPSCEVESHYVLNLSELETIPMKDPKKRVFETTLPSGKTARFRVGTGADEEVVSKVPDDEKPTAMLLTRLELLDNKAPMLLDMKNLSFRDRQALREAYDEQDGGVETDMDMQCPACGHDFKKPLDLAQQGFFFPHRVQKVLRKKSGG